MDLEKASELIDILIDEFEREVCEKTKDCGPQEEILKILILKYAQMIEAHILNIP